MLRLPVAGPLLFRFNPNNYDRISKTGESQLTCFNDPYSTPGSFAELGAQ